MPLLTASCGWQGDPVTEQARGAEDIPSPSLDPDSALEEKCRQLYLDLLKGAVTRSAFLEGYRRMRPWIPWERRVRRLNILLSRKHLEIVRAWPLEIAHRFREEGTDWPMEAETMIGLARLNNVQDCVSSAVREGVPGDVIECGVWRGGTTIFMKGVLEAYGDTERSVWVADSFKGVPPPQPERYPLDEGAKFSERWELSVSVEQVRANFARYGLLDERVRFLEGWFSDTLPEAPIERLAVLRIDGDLYQSTIEALRFLYPKVSPGGYVIVDDYGGIENARAAVDDFRVEAGVTEELMKVDWTGVFWRRSL